MNVAALVVGVRVGLGMTRRGLTRRFAFFARVTRMLALRRDAHRERDAFVIARAARAAFAFALYARDCAREPAPNNDETTDDDDARDDDARDDDGARDDDDAFNSRAVGVARRRRRNEGRARGTRARTRGERTRRRRARETRRALARAFDARAFERLRPRRVVMTLGTTATRTREAYEMDLRGVAYAETTTTREDEREETADAVSRRAVRAFVPVMATLNPPQSAGLRAFFFVEARATTDEVEGYAPKPGFAPAKRARVERRRVRVVVNGDASDDRDDASDDESSDDLVWYQADAAVRAASSSMI